MKEGRGLEGGRGLGRRECRLAYEQFLGRRGFHPPPHAAFPLLTRPAASPDFPTMKPIIPIRRKKPFDDPAYLFELKLDGFRQDRPAPNSAALFQSRLGWNPAAIPRDTNRLEEWS